MCIRYSRYAVCFLVIAMASCSSGALTIQLENVKWIHGSADCQQNTDRPIQVVKYNSSTWVLRQNKCLNYEAPFMFVLFGETSAILIDTGATPDSLSFPLHHVIDSLMHEFYSDRYSKVELVVAHTHAHGDHHAADSQFIGKPRVKVVGLSLPEVKSFFNISDWPNQIQKYDLGNRVIDLIPIPGHDETSLAFYDRETDLLFSGDTFYPGRLYVRDWKAFRLSIKRLMDFSKAHEVKYFVGNHIEMTNVAEKDYPIGTTYQPQEHSLVLSVNDLEKLNLQLEKLGDSVKRVWLDDFIIYPVEATLSKEIDIKGEAIVR